MNQIGLAFIWTNHWQTNRVNFCYRFRRSSFGLANRDIERCHACGSDVRLMQLLTSHCWWLAINFDGEIVVHEKTSQPFPEYAALSRARSLSLSLSVSLVIIIELFYLILPHRFIDWSIEQQYQTTFSDNWRENKSNEAVHLSAIFRYVDHISTGYS